MDTPTHYELLCVTPDATAEDIRAAYRRLIRMYHPDVAGAAGEAMTLRLNNAQTDLLDPVTRAQYDRRRMYATSGAPPRESTPREHTQWQPRSTPDYSSPTGATSTGPSFTGPVFTAPAYRPNQYRAWLAVAVGSIALIVTMTVVVFAYSYSGPLDLTTPRIIPPLVIAIAWIVAGIRRPAKIFIALLVIAAAMWPLSLAGVEPFSLMAQVVPTGVLALLTVVATAVLALRISAPQVAVRARTRTAAA